MVSVQGTPSNLQQRRALAKSAGPPEKCQPTRSYGERRRVLDMLDKFQNDQYSEAFEFACFVCVCHLFSSHRNSGYHRHAIIEQVVFKFRGELYNNILKEIFVFDNKSHDIISLNSKLTYKYITDISKKTKIILLDLHITVFTSLRNFIASCCRVPGHIWPLDLSFAHGLRFSMLIFWSRIPRFQFL